jgi:hypothetical protein
MSEFILVEHYAIKRGKHWDLRFEIPNSKNWISFAFSKFPPSTPGERVYIPRTTDHSRENALYLGKIDEGEYGAGTLKKVDGGNCEIIKFSNAHIVVDFKGKKLHGIYHLINMGVIRHNYKSKIYTFFKGKI